MSFHGGLDAPNAAEARNIRCKVLVWNGGEDPLVPAKDEDAFEGEMQAEVSASVWHVNHLMLRGSRGYLILPPAPSIPPRTESPTSHPVGSQCAHRSAG